MKAITIYAMSGGLLLAAAAAANPGGGSGTVQYRATATFSDGSSADRVYAVAAGDLDGDGVSDTAWLRVRCDGGGIGAAYLHTVKSPRDAASGQASGRRMHRPFKIIKEWDAKTAGAGRSLGWNLKENKGARTGGSVVSYDVKKVEGTGARAAGGAKTMAHDDWHEVTLADGSPNFCTID